MHSDLIVEFWDNDLNDQMKPEEKLLYLYLLSSPQGNSIGIFPTTYGKIRFHTKLSEAQIKEALSGLSEKQLVFVEKMHVIIKHKMSLSLNPRQRINRIKAFLDLPTALQKSILHDDYDKLCGDPDYSKESIKIISDAITQYDGTVRKKVRVKSEEQIIYKEFLDEVIKMFPEAKRPENNKEYQEWHRTLRLLIDSDKFTEDQIRTAIDSGLKDKYQVKYFHNVHRLRVKHKDQKILYARVFLNLIESDKNKTPEALQDAGSRQDF